MAKKFTEQHRVKFYECDTMGHLTLPMILNIVIKTSEAQSDALGRGTEYVNDKGLTWVITQHEMTIHRLPKTGELITSGTQAKNYNKFFCYRNFWITDEAGNDCVTIESTFVLMNLKTRKVSSVSEDIISPYGSEKITKIRRPDKIVPVETTDNKQVYRVRFSDIDANKHVNNSKYLDWMTDVLGYDFLANHQPKKVNIRFEKEIEYGHLVDSFWEKDLQQEEILTKHRIKVEDGVFAEANMEWRKN